ncbi:protein TsetseEP-like [Musca vetustissima]|uniref:protein TsetseEP-like n=1 Tax=Musca vetustissima TaxID=27455 RepID=UPI002AB780B0|nr:protein TsetseEP-like [Musca vetustissima]
MWILSVLLLAVASKEAFSFNVVPLVERNLANTILKSSHVMRDNSPRNLECFSVYLPLINEATNKYEAAYAQCLDTADNATKAVEAEVAADRATVSYEAEGICTLYQECSQKTSSLDFFDCYSETAASAISSSYDIQTLSKNKWQYVNNRYQVIAYEQKTCTDTCADEYVKESTALYAALDTCLAGGGFPTPSPAPTTPKPVEPETTTIAPVVTTTEVVTTTPEPVPETTTVVPEPETTAVPEPETTNPLDTTPAPVPETTTPHIPTPPPAVY